MSRVRFTIIREPFLDDISVVLNTPFARLRVAVRIMLKGKITL